MLAMNVPDNAFIQTVRVIVDDHREQARSTGIGGICNSQVGFKAASPCFGFGFWRPANDEAERRHLRSGETGMDAGLAALGQGWPIAAGPVRSEHASVAACRRKT